MGQNRNVELDNFEQTYYNAQDTYEDESSWLRNKNFVQMYDNHNDKLLVEFSYYSPSTLNSAKYTEQFTYSTV